MYKRIYCATCAYFRDKDAMGLGCCERHRHVVFGGAPACDDALRPIGKVARIFKAIFVTLRKWLVKAKPTRYRLSRVGR